MTESKYYNFYNPYNPSLINLTKIRDTTKKINNIKTFTILFDGNDKLENALKDIYGYMNLEANWDGYGALPISNSVINNVQNLLLRGIPVIPSLSPSSSNSILLVFPKYDSELIIEVFESNYGFAIVKNDLSEYHEESDLEYNYIEIYSIVNKYYGMQTFYK
jgi:hypothetical protein